MSDRIFNVTSESMFDVMFDSMVFQCMLDISFHEAFGALQNSRCNVREHESLSCPPASSMPRSRACMEEIFDSLLERSFHSMV